MLVQQSVIGDKARKVLRKGLDRHFGDVEPGQDLNSAVKEVLNDRDLFNFLAVNLEENEGLRLDAVEYWDDISVYDHYGLTLDFNVPRKTKLFVFESLILQGEFAAQGLGAELIGIGEGNIPHRLLSEVNSLLQTPYNMLLEKFPAKRLSDDMQYSSGYPSVDDFCNNVNRVLQDSASYKISLPTRE